MESVIALAIFSLISAALASLLLGGSSGSLEGAEYTHADALAQEGIEAVRSIRDRAWNELNYSATGLVSAGGTWTFEGEGTSDSETPYTRQITLEPVCRSIAGDVAACPGIATDFDTLYVTSSVSWKSSGGADLVRLRSSYITNWDSKFWTQTDWSGGSGQALWSDVTKYDSDDGGIDYSVPDQLSLTSSLTTGTWSSVSSPVDDEGLNSISTVSPTDIWAVGESGKIIHYNGTSWSEFTDVGSAELYSIAMVSSTDGWAVGESGKIFHYDGTSWSQFIDVGSQTLYSISMFSASYGWAVGGNGEIYRYDGTTWTSFTSPITQHLNAVQALSTTDAWIGADSGIFLHFDGTSWSQITDLGGNNVESLFMVSASSGWAGGQNGEIYRYDGTSWSIFTDTGNEVWQSISLASSNDGWIFGTGGALRHWNGSAWSVYASSTSDGLRDVVLLPDQSGWAVGDDGVILRYVPGPPGYASDANFTSSAFSMTDASPIQTLAWDQVVPSCTPSCYIRLQLRSAPDAGGVPGVYSSWYGASGEETYFTNAAGTLPPIQLNGNQWVQYRVEIHGDGTQTPVLQEVRVNYK